MGELKAGEAADTLLYFLDNPREGVYHDLLLTALSKMGCTRIMPLLEKRLQDSVWYHHTAALRSMLRIDSTAAKQHIYAALEDENPLVRREAVNMLLETLPGDAVPYLERVTQDEQWDVRFYARQAIRLINEKTRDRE